MDNRNNNEYLELEKSRLADGQVRIEKLKGIAGAYNALVDQGGRLLKSAYDTYMGGDRVEDWEIFEKYMQLAADAFRDATKQLHLLAEIVPSQVPPERFATVSGIITRINNTLLDYHQKWGKRLKQEEIDRILALKAWTCAALLVAGVHNELDSVEGEAYCHNECKYRETCDGEGL